MTVAELAERYRAGELEKFVNTRTAAGWLGVNYETLLRAAKSGDATLRPVKVGAVYRWPSLLLLQAMGVEAGVVTST